VGDFRVSELARLAPSVEKHNRFVLSESTRPNLSYQSGHSFASIRGVEEDSLHVGDEANGIQALGCWDAVARADETTQHGHLRWAYHDFMPCQARGLYGHARDPFHALAHRAADGDALNLPGRIQDFCPGHEACLSTTTAGRQHDGVHLKMGVLELRR